MIDNIPDRIAALHRQATQYKDIKDWDNAVACLREAATLAPQSGVCYSAAHYARLPVILQQAGKFDESIQIFERLLAGVEALMAKHFGHQPKSTQKMLSHATYATIYDKMRLACQRQKLPEKVSEYAALSEMHKEHHRRMLEAENKRLEAKHKRKR